MDIDNPFNVEEIISKTRKLQALGKVLTVMKSTLDGETNDGIHRIRVGVTGSSDYSDAAVEDEYIFQDLYIVLIDKFQEQIREIGTTCRDFYKDED